MSPRTPAGPPLRTAAESREALDALADPERAARLARFFQVRPGGYGEGDVLAGVTVPQQRSVARRCRELPLPALAELLGSDVHEHRLTALLVMVDRYRRGDAATRRALHQQYAASLDRVDGWDLVDASAPDLMGDATCDAGPAPLLALAAAPDVWRRRVAMVATFADIRAGQSGCCASSARGAGATSWSGG